jgi:hypothetical protein
MLTMQTRSKTSMARQVVFTQTSGNENEHRKWANKIKQTNQAIKQIKQTNTIAKRSIYLALGKPSKQVVIKRTSGKRKRAPNTGPIKSNKENEAINRSSKPTKLTRHGHGLHGSVTARTPRFTARTPRSRRARFGHGARATVTACTSQSLCAWRGTAGTVDTAGPAASATRLLQRAQRSG